MHDAVHLQRRLEVIPDLLAMHEAQPARYPFLLESAARAEAAGGDNGRFSILFAFPGDSISCPAGADPDDFFQRLDEAWRQERLSATTSHLPFTGGWFFYLAYEMAGVVEPKLNLPSDGDMPRAWAARVPAAVIIDHGQQAAWAVAEPGQEDNLAEICRDAAQAQPRQAEPEQLLGANLVEEDPSLYCRAVERARHYIHDGDIFQANLSRAWRGQLAEDVRPQDVYRRLRRTNPGPFAGLAVRGDQAIISSSPERLVSRRDDWVNTRPIAGTRPRGQLAGEDDALRSELIGHPKERAEHIMLIDLERNDLGRICRPGTVEVNELMVLESYAHVHHIVSNVRGRVADSVSPGEILQAVFPGGTITGCPKVRCMEIIAELEARPRGAYTGSLGYINRDGSMDSSILIRTMECQGRDLRLLAGGGIVADSVPDRELEETRAKARGMVLALEPGS
ncbi:aminodeoxychorismate synthase component I [Gammaproteobacteria bacterium AB-CW1]|uniref:Aminodeoxychorismate synthase component I n=1 Tax=Natronospira elongata TaxID=3110268 RepID=A0AAP6MJS5_9GAMM|nr:aminodeoxychorismate synthase component I [Gammaproteobacteria bacterium AB-CW1]